MDINVDIGYPCMSSWGKSGFRGKAGNEGREKISLHFKIVEIFKSV